ncbi:MAG: glycoside hydrolase family 3 N-terminal domain-containing protein [Candidatus Eisenbacteria bacterium]|nr:glycoside hydrolase family 3 N-terminal domain-containing protein [Candidatus Eisenbacteria bacterium]
MTPDDALLRWIRGLSPARRIAQLLIVAPDPEETPEEVVAWFTESGYGGLFLQWRHLGEREWLFELIDRLRDRPDDSPPPLITVDEEGGLVSDLTELTNTAPSPAALGMLDDSMTTFRTALAMGDKIRAMGFNLLLAPSLDVNGESRNPVIGTRAFGATPQIVVKHGLAALEGYARAGLVTCVKHFPGHGSTRLDSHLALPILDAPLELLEVRDLPPFRAAIDGGVQAIMTGHLACPALDPSGAPATLSPIMLNGFLRGELGFEGVILSDDMEMAGVAALGNPGAVARNAIEAGVDALLYARNRDMAAEVASELTRAMLRGELAEERVLTSLARLWRLRRTIQAAETEMDETAREEILDMQHEEFLREVTRQTITQVGHRGPELPVPWSDQYGLIIVPTNNEPRLDVDVEYLRDLIVPLRIGLQVTSLRPTDDERAAALYRASRADFIIACTLTRGAVVPEQRRLIDDLLGLKKQLTVVSLLDPHDLAEYPTVRTRLATRGFNRSALAGLIKVLTGITDPLPESP